MPSNVPVLVVPPAVAPPPRGDTPPQTSPSTAGDASPGGTPVSPLPLVLTRYFGRAEEQKHLVEMLSGEDTRLVTLIGPGGAGKTRLSLEVARQISPVFAGRVWWVSLADLPDARLLSSALTRALKVSETGATDPLEAVLARLNEAPCLLILDNIETPAPRRTVGGANADHKRIAYPRAKELAESSRYGVAVVIAFNRTIAR
ncbi:MAG: hypothetical protein H7145_19730 [Akkermansiaceae bacterium]|nr:hypothetical protein [Armatimonadota bacterium]